MPAGSFINLPPNKPPEPPRPIVTVALAHVAGMGLGIALAWPAIVWTLLIVLPLGFAAIFLWRSRRIRSEATPEGGLLLISVLAIGGYLGSGLELRDRAALASLPDWAEEQLVTAEGYLAEEPRGLGDGIEFVLGGTRIRSMHVGGGSASVPGRVAVALHDFMPEKMPQRGQAVRVIGRFRRADRPATTPTVFDAPAYWRSRGVFGRIALASPPSIEVGPAPTGWPAQFLSAMRVARGWMRRNLDAHLDGNQLALAYALLIGDTAGLDNDVRDAFMRTGLAHVLSVSGLHTGFILIMLLGLGRLMWLPPRAGAWLAIAGIVMYAALTGFHPPVVRAAVMGIFILLSLPLGRFTTPLASIATAAWLTLLLDPRNILRIDWQLSYMCALSIIVLTPALHEFLYRPFNPPPKPGERRDPLPHWKRLAGRWIVMPVAVILAVQLGLAPLQAYHFQNLNPGSLVSNLLIVPLSGLVVGAALAASLAGGVPVLGAVAGWVAGNLSGAMVWGIGWLEKFPLMSVTVSPWPLWVAALYILLLFCGAHLLTGRERFLMLDARQRAALAVCYLGCLAIILVAPFLRTQGRGLLDFYMLDVGQGDSLVVRFPNGKVMVIDGGANAPSDQGRFAIGPFLQTAGMRRIDCLVATHADADHIGGLPWLIRNYPIGQLLSGSDLSSSLIYRDLLQAIKEEGVTVIQAEAGARLRGFGIEIELLGPLAGRDDNDASIGMLIDAGDVEILATGDMEAAAERQLLQERRVRDIEVLKVGHHGSRSSSIREFLEEARPEIALISAGRRNRYGHPAPEVLRRLEQSGALTLRTDWDGTIWLRTDGRWISVYRFAGPL